LKNGLLGSKRAVKVLKQAVDLQNRWGGEKKAEDV
jgi:hypothetical protein